jgi:hypothetical protein
MEQAVQALRRYHKAQETQPAEEVEKLRLEAEALFVAVNEYQRQVFGVPAQARQYYSVLIICRGHVQRASVGHEG